MFSIVNALALGLSILAFIVFLALEFYGKRFTSDRTLTFCLGILPFWSGIILLFLLLLGCIQALGVNILNQTEASFLNDYGIVLFVGGGMSVIGGIVSILKLYPDATKKREEEIIEKSKEKYDATYKHLQRLLKELDG